jgi:hypothetical protein
MITGTIDPTPRAALWAAVAGLSLQADSFEPMGRGWRRGWGDWGPSVDWLSATSYSGRVVANLQSADNQRLRCRFDLNRPIDGMGGGGQGQCQFGGGRTVDAVFQRS